MTGIARGRKSLTDWNRIGVWRDYWSAGVLPDRCVLFDCLTDDGNDVWWGLCVSEWPESCLTEINFWQEYFDKSDRNNFWQEDWQQSFLTGRLKGIIFDKNAFDRNNFWQENWHEYFDRKIDRNIFERKIDRNNFWQEIWQELFLTGRLTGIIYDTKIGRNDFCQEDWQE